MEKTSMNGAERSAGAVPRRLGTSWRNLSRRLGRTMPKGLFARSLIIVVAPVILLQSIVAFVFMERHWLAVTQRLSTAVVRDIAAIIELVEAETGEAGVDRVLRIAQDQLALKVDLLPGKALPPPGTKPFFSNLDQALSTEITQQIARPFWLDTVGASNIIEIRVQLDEQRTLRVFARRSQAYASNSIIFLAWMSGTSIVLLSIAILFLRNQIKPIQQLAQAAESFGRGRPPPAGFSPRGADEVRRAGQAFIRMRERIERQIEQRTAMLAGISHDLRTILTRFRLQLALIAPKADLSGLDRDVADMQSMLEGYLAFARGEAAEDAGELDLNDLFGRFGDEARLRKRHFSATMNGEPVVRVRPSAFARLVGNLVDNAFRHARSVRLEATHGRGTLLITIDDDGPGVLPGQRDEVFKPFVRLDTARNQDTGGTGLGLAIARDIARSHGGEVTLDDSPLGGLRAIVRVPV